MSVRVGAQPSAAIPPMRPLGPIVATSKDMLGAVDQIRVLSDGRVLVNDSHDRRVVLFDATLAHFTQVIDTTSETARAYGVDGGALFSSSGDTSMFGDVASLSMLVIDPTGKVVRVIAAPRVRAGIGLAWVLFPGYGATMDGHGHILSQWTVNQLLGLRGGMSTAQPSTPQELHPSAAVIRVDLITKAADTVAYLALPSTWVLPSVGPSNGMRLLLPLDNPLPAEDDWTVMADGTIAVVRELDYHIDWYALDGSHTSTPRIAHEWVRVTDSMKTAIVDSARTADSIAAFREHVMDSVHAAAAARTGGANSGGGGSGQGVGAGFGAGAPSFTTTSHTPRYVDPAVLPDYLPPFLAAPDSLGARAVKADAEGNVWIRVNQPKRGEGGTIYDVVNRGGKLIDRIQLPGGTTLVGFGSGVAYVISREGAGYILARARIR